MRENSEHIQHPPTTDFSLAKFYDDGRNCLFSNPCCGAQFTSRDAEVIPNQYINLVFGHCCHCYHCCGWLPLQSLSPMSFPLLSKQWTQHLSELTSMASSPYMLLRSLWISIGLEASAVRNSITTLCLVHTSTFAILYCFCGDNTCMEHWWCWCSWSVSLSSR